MNYTTTMNILHHDKVRVYRITDEDTGETAFCQLEQQNDHGWKTALIEAVREHGGMRGAITYIQQMTDTPEYVGSEDPHWM